MYYAGVYVITLMPELEGPGGPLAPPIFGRSVNPIPTRKGRLSPPITTGTPNVYHLTAPFNKFWPYSAVRIVRRNCGARAAASGGTFVNCPKPRRLVFIKQVSLAKMNHDRKFARFLRFEAALTSEDMALAY